MLEGPKATTLEQFGKSLLNILGVGEFKPHVFLGCSCIASYHDKPLNFSFCFSKQLSDNNQFACLVPHSSFFPGLFHQKIFIQDNVSKIIDSV